MSPVAHTGSRTGSRLRAVDLFCGCGGSSTGAAAVPGVEVTHAFNHWERAVESHAANHPNTDAALTDLFEVHPAAFPPMEVLLASPECRTHSPARGTKRRGLGQVDLFHHTPLAPEDVKSRVTAWTVVHWASVHRPLFVIVENVVEFARWHDETGSFAEWLRAMENLGYEHEAVYVNGMHVHGLTDARLRFVMPQTRDRVYVVFWRRGNPRPDLDLRPLAYCPTCDADVLSVRRWKNGRRWGRYRRQYVYECPACKGANRPTVVEPYAFAAAGSIDWSLPAVRIGDREKHGLRPLSPKTIARIEYGRDRYGLRPYAVVNRYSSGVDCRVKGLHEPLPTQPSQPVVGMVQPGFLAPLRSGRPRANGLDEPLNTVVANGSNHALVVDTAQPGYREKRPSSVGEPLPTQTTRQTQALVTPSGGTWAERPQAAEEPLPSLTTREAWGLVVPNRTNNHPRPADEPMPTVLTGTTLGLLTILRTHCQSQPAEAPMPTVVAGGTHLGLATLEEGAALDPSALCTLRGPSHFSGLDGQLPTQTGVQQVAVVSRSPYLVSYYGTHNASGAFEPMPVVTTVDRHALVEPDPDAPKVEVEDLCFRMLEPHELKVGTGHPADYVLVGTKRDRVKLVGNSNYPGIEQWLLSRCLATLEGSPSGRAA